MSSAVYKDLVEMQKKSVSTFGDKKLFGTKKNGSWEWTTYKQFGEMIDNCRGGFAARGIGPGDTVAIIASNRVEWAVGAYGAYGLGARFVPMYEHQLEDDWKYIAEDSGAKLLIVSKKEIYERVKGWVDEIEQITDVICIDLPDDHPKSFKALLAEGKEKPFDTVAIDPESVCGFIYTSGTTGRPKGVLLSHSNFVSNVNAVNEIFPLEPTDISVSFLPWAHSFGQTAELHTMLSMGCGIAFAEAIDKLIDNFGEVRPTVMVSVPRIFNKIYSGLQAKMDETGGLKKKLFYSAVANENKRRQLKMAGKYSSWKNFKSRVYDKLVFSKVRDRFGGRLRYAFSGGAALSKEVAEFIDSVGILVYEGYGLTETSPIACANYRKNRKIGSVGKPIPRVEVKIDTSVVEDSNGDGEIVVYGPNVMKGYHNLPEETAKVMTEDGGFRTGDRGRKDEEGFIYITGRIKEQYKLENGKYVVPGPLEDLLQLSPYILQVFIDGANKLYNAALIVPDKEAILGWAKENGLTGSYAEILKDVKTYALIEAEIKEFGKGFKGYEKVKKFALLEEEFSNDNGMLTPKMSLKRRKVVGVYGDLLNELWGVTK
jgi:long-chain acyl-CoA synthetase